MTVQDPAPGSAAALAVDYDPFAGAAFSRVVPTTEPQREVWLADRLGQEASLAYNESIALRFGGPLDVPALQGALQDLYDRHEALRGTVGANGEELLIATDVVLHVPVTDHGALDAAQRERAVEAARQRVVEAPFDLEAGPLFRAEILVLGPDDHLLLITAHHIVCDGWSFGVLVKDLAALYARRRGADTVLDAPASFGDYASARSAAFGGAEASSDEAFWLSRFEGAVPSLDLPTDRPRGAWRTFTSRREDFTLEAGLVADVRKAGAKSGASLFATLLAGFAALLQRIAGAADVVVGMPAAGQSVGGLDNLVGHCVNLLPLRLAVNPDATLKDLVAATQGAMLDAYEHQGYTFGTLLKKLSIERDPSRMPLVSVIFNIDQALDANTVGFPGVTAEFFSNPRSFENFELFINAVQVKGALRLECQYNADLFDGATVRRWLELYREALARWIAQPGAQLADLLAPTDAERALLAGWNATDRVYESGLRLSDLVQRGMRNDARATAVRFEGRSVPYGELDDIAWSIAQCVRDAGAKPGTLVGVCLERSVELVGALAGVIYSGAAYVPMDPTYPIDRLTRMGEDAALSIIVTRRAEFDRAGAAFPAGARVILLDEAALAAVPPAQRVLAGADTDPAYVIFTSGSTGRPKGAMNAHKGIVNRLLWMQEAYRLAAADRVMQKTPYSFDVSVWEFFWPLMIGATIVVARPEGHRDSAYLAGLIQSEGVTVLHFVPSMLRIFLDDDAAAGCTSVRQTVCSGEALPFDVVERFFARLPDAQLANLYGPTEAAVDVTAWNCRPHDPLRMVPIGKPIANTQMHVLDAALRPMPVGSFGELYIGGVQVGMGYVARPDLTAERFLPDPFHPGGRIYKTGDVGRWRMDGAIEYSGRADFQVKIRGNRIELGEIEACLAGQPQVGGAVVVTREDRAGDVRLVAYVVARGAQAPAEGDLIAHLKAALPEYMIPQHFVTLASIPLLSNGKVDRKALPAPAAASAAQFVAPRTDLERTVAKEMEVSLGLPGIGVDDDFFALGGHSLLAMQLTARLNRAFKTHLSMRTVFEAPTVARLSAAIEAEAGRASDESRIPIVPLADQSVAPLSVMQERLWFMEELYPGRVTYHAPSAHRLVGKLDERAFDAAFREMVRRQSALRTRFERDGYAAVQRVDDAIELALFPAEDLTPLAPQDREARMLARLEQVTAETFDLTRTPLFKVRLFRMSDAEHVLFFMPHHIIWDGWSFDLFYEEMSALYAAFCAGRPSPLARLAISYGDFAAWHRAWIESPEFGRQLDFWRARLARIGRPQELPTDKPRKPGMSGGGSTEWMAIDKARTDRLHDIAKSADATLFVTMLAAYGVLLHGYSQQTNLVIGTPVRGRNAVEFEPIMGFFNNLLLLQFDIRPGERFADLVRRVKASALESFTCPDVPLEELARELAVAGTAGGGVLYQALFSFQDGRQRITRWGELAHSVIPLFQQGATEDFGMWFVESARGLHGGVTYNTDILTNATARILREHYVAMLDAIVADPGVTVERLVGPPEGALRRVEHWTAPAESAAQAGAAAPRGEPASETEKILAAIWCEQLKLPSVSTQDNFFDLGGHSLLAMQAILAMEARVHKRVDRSRFIFESLGQIARSYDEAPLEPVEKQGGLKRLFATLIGGKKS